MKTVIIHRDYTDNNHSLGVCYIRDEQGTVIFKSESLERGWRNNENNVSCVPEGEYALKLEHSSRFKKKLWELKGVPNRAECKFHAANHWHQLNGCIALGKDRKYIDSDKEMDVTSSRATMDIFHRALGNDTEARLIVRNIF